MPIQYLDARCYFLNFQMRKKLLVTRPTILGIVSLEKIRFCEEAYVFECYYNNRFCEEAYLLESYCNIRFCGEF